MDMKKIISNWDELTDQQKKDAEEKYKGDPGLNPAVVHPAAKFFEEHRWVKIDKFIDSNMCNLLYHHIQLETARLNYYDENDISYSKEMDGEFTDPQAPGDFSKYGDPIMDTLLSLSLEQMQTLTGKELVPTYSYHRLYTTGTELKKHSDRSSCEISTTLCLGYDVSNVDASKYPDWDWPMFIEEPNGEEIPVHMKPGDMIIYRGCELNHWREPFWGNNHAQVFLHYNEKGGEYDIPNDGRPILGMPGTFREKNAVEKQDKPYTENKVINTSKKIIY
jgi:hypothetical protein